MFSFKGVKPETPDFVRLVKQLPPSALRMPCGTGMNFWDWNSGQPYPPERFEALGFDLSHFSFKWLASEAKKIREQTGPLTPERLMAFSKTTGHEPLIGINVTTATPDENLRFLKRLKSTGVRPLGFELGNEMYLRNNRHGMETAKEYMATCRRHTEVIRQVFPQTKIGIVIREDGHKLWNLRRQMGIDKSKPTWTSQWNRLAAAHGFEAYDAIIIHTYVEPGEWGDLDTATVADMNSYAFARSAPATLRHVLGYYEQRYPGKEIWITEWDLTMGMWRKWHWKGKGKGWLRFRTEGTLFQTLFLADYVLNLAAHEPTVAVATYFSLFKLIAPGTPPTPTNAVRFFAMLASPIRDCDSIEACSIANVPNLPESRALPGVVVPGIDAFLFRCNGEARYLAVINKLPQDVKLNLSLPTLVASNGTMGVLTADELLPQWRVDKETWAWDPQLRHHVGSARLDRPFSVPKWSFSVVRFGRAKE